MLQKNIGVNKNTVSGQKISIFYHTDKPKTYLVYLIWISSVDRSFLKVYFFWKADWHAGFLWTE